MSRSSSRSRVRAKSEPSARAAWGIAVVALLTPGACDVYTADLLTLSAGGAHSASGGTLATNFGGGQPPQTAGSSTHVSTSEPPNAGGGGSGGATSGATTSSASLGGIAGRSTDTHHAEGGAEQTSSAQTILGAGTAGNLNGGAAGTTTVATGGNSAQRCYLDDMLGPIASGPLTGCDASRVSYWASFLPPAESIVFKPPTIEPDPGVLFERQTIVPADTDVLGDSRFVATVSGSVIVSDKRKYSGIRFPLYVGPPYAMSGASLQFYYRTRFTSLSSALRVNVPTTATTSNQKPGGTCKQNCDDHFGISLQNTSGNWSFRSVRLETISNQGDLTRDWEQSDGVTFDVNQVLAIEFGFSASEPFEFSIGPIWLQWAN